MAAGDTLDEVQNVEHIEHTVQPDFRKEGGGARGKANPSAPLLPEIALMEDGLDAIGILHGVDKSSLSHGYLVQYERILGPLRRTQITLLEIGVSQGASGDEQQRARAALAGI